MKAPTRALIVEDHDTWVSILDRAARRAGASEVVACEDLPAVKEALRRARSGEGPTLIECKTYRTRPHSEGMRDGGYRTMEEIESWKARDPIQMLHSTLVAEGLAEDAELNAIDAEIQAQITEAYEFARNSPYPDPATASNHIYSS